MKPKEQAIEDFKKMAYNSWTYAKLTETEKESLDEAFISQKLKGNYNQRWNQLQSVYMAFLYALAYKPIGWR